MERYVNSDGSIAKYVHDDGSETSIKTWPEGMQSCGGSQREKFNVFISISSGCFVKCGFCFLTAKGFPYNKITSIAAAHNAILAIQDEFDHRPHLKDMPMNLSFMGMGDCWMNLEDVYRIVGWITSWFNDVKIEGVDIATTLPRIAYDDVSWLRKIKNILQFSGKLVDRPFTRTPVRLFYSLMSPDIGKRKRMIPNSIGPDVALRYLHTLKDEFNVIMHVLFLDGVNDSPTDIASIISAMEYFPESQLRLLRFNQCPNSKYKESTRIDKIIEVFSTSVRDFKYQLSPGSEISAACGMFLMKDISSNGKG